MYDIRPVRSIAFLAILALLIRPGSLLGSTVNYSTCPGYPLVACPGTWASVPIPDNNLNGVTILLDVPSDGENYITDVNVSFFITHTYQGDIRAVLTSPAGTSVELVNRAGSPGCGGFGYSADDFGRTHPQFFFLQEFVLDDAAAAIYNPPAAACPGINQVNSSVNGAYRPVSPLSAFNGQSKVGPWRLTLQDMVGQDTGTLWVWGMTIRTEPNTPPVVDLALPDDYACGCANGPITGTATEPDGTFTNYRLEWSVDSAGPWNLINTSTSPVSNGLLGNFPGAMPEGHSYVRLIATNAIGMSSTFVKVIHQDRTFGGTGILNPVNGAIVGGNVCTNKVAASDYCFASAALAYKPSGGAFTTFFTANSPPQEFPPWNTAGLLDGDYTFRVTGTTVCGASSFAEVNVTVDNTPPVATISSPAICANVSGVVQVIGTVTDAHFGGWTLQYAGGNSNGWQTISSGNTQVVGGLLGSWNTAGLPNCGYTLRLLANDASTVSCFGSNSAEYLVCVRIGGAGGGSCDVNGDTLVNGNDIPPLVNCLVSP